MSHENLSDSAIETSLANSKALGGLGTHNVIKSFKRTDGGTLYAGYYHNTLSGISVNDSFGIIKRSTDD